MSARPSLHVVSIDAYVRVSRVHVDTFFLFRCVFPNLVCLDVVLTQLLKGLVLQAALPGSPSSRPPVPPAPGAQFP